MFLVAIFYLNSKCMQHDCMYPNPNYNYLFRVPLFREGESELWNVKCSYCLLYVICSYVCMCYVATGLRPASKLRTALRTRVSSLESEIISHFTLSLSLSRFHAFTPPLPLPLPLPLPVFQCFTFEFFFSKIWKWKSQRTNNVTIYCLRGWIWRIWNMKHAFSWSYCCCVTSNWVHFF